MIFLEPNIQQTYVFSRAVAAINSLTDTNFKEQMFSPQYP